jgi:hypothetical protein
MKEMRNRIEYKMENMIMNSCNDRSSGITWIASGYV